MKLSPKKLESWGYRMVKIHYPNFNRFCRIHPCDGQTDRRTHGRAIAYTRYSIYAVARKNWLSACTSSGIRLRRAKYPQYTTVILRRGSGATFSKLVRKILGRFLILGQSLTISGKTLTIHNFALLTNSRFTNNVT